jgi:hypothetical protein
VKQIIEWQGDDGFVVHRIDDFTEQVLPRLCNSQRFEREFSCAYSTHLRFGLAAFALSSGN